MKRLTTDRPEGNFETMLNFVYGKDGWAHIRHDGENADVPLHEWIKCRCLEQGCDEMPCATPEEIAETVMECAMNVDYTTGRTCPIATAYVFACQAVELRGRLKKYEDLFFDEDGAEKFYPLERLRVAPEKLRELESQPAADWLLGKEE